VTVRLIGANPGLTLYAGEDDDTRVGYASVWRVDWSAHGTGTAIITWHGGRTRVITATPRLGGWLAAEFTRHFPEVRGLAWPDPRVLTAPVALELDLSHGMRAAGAGVEVEVTGPLDRRVVRVEEFDLGGTPNALSTVIIPCREGSLRIDGAEVPGTPRVVTSPRASSSAFLADAEVWSHPDPPPAVP
jgi:hypothetical protein